jgi:hypothetical protein
MLRLESGRRDEDVTVRLESGRSEPNRRALTGGCS